MPNLGFVRGSKEKAPSQTGRIEGVASTEYIIDGNKNKDTKLTVKSNDLISIEFKYALNESLPKSASQKSTNPEVVKALGIRQVVNVKGPAGVGYISAVFAAQQKGKTQLS